ncbi:hypothetical protein [Shewanella pealeana]|uniref:Uncharacterized protein n=1 Tax=Shewanella pealeana (strain ATCC 700345 / ANG-SQ1) TaxID=398579 RepID=A8H4U7_SHEPA|nr:hypothetical protein [Shewanella pealeana]ABV87584.1 hypothetical protein Spea_2264 [Shewanella pealeana ATCC 700345]
MINTLMFAAALFQADISQVKPVAEVDIDKKVIATQIETELNNAWAQMTLTLEQESSALKEIETNAELVEFNSLQDRKLTRLKYETGRL